VRYYSAATANSAATDSPRGRLRAELAAALGELDAAVAAGLDPLIENLRSSAPAQDDDGRPFWPELPATEQPSYGDGGPGSRGIRFPQQHASKRPSNAVVEERLAMLQRWISERQPLAEIRKRAKEQWQMNSIFTIDKYMRIARGRMVDDLIDGRLYHQAEQIYALMDVARRAADCEQFNASVGAHRVICEIAGFLRSPLKPKDERP